MSVLTRVWSAMGDGEVASWDVVMYIGYSVVSLRWRMQLDWMSG